MTTAVALPPTPSDALAVLAHAMACSPTFVAQTLQSALDDADVQTEPPQDWTLPGPRLIDEVFTSLGDKWPPDPPATPEEFARYAAVLQRLDRWHKPLLPHEVDLPRQAEHESLLDRMAIDDRFNANLECGTVIARQSLGTAFLRVETSGLNFDTTSTPYAIVCLLLDVCVFLPPNVAAGDPDANSSTTGTRLIKVKYRRFPAAELGIGWHPETLRVAIAPIFECDDDARISIHGDRYTIKPDVPFSRLEAIIQAAILERTQILLLPEMTVEASLLPAFGRAIRQIRRAALLANPQELPSLRLAIVGVIEAPEIEGDHYRNYIAALSSEGVVLFTQDKLSHWNLNAPTQARFGVTHPTTLLENTLPGESILIAEFDGLGRILALICADMSHDLPGDWIADNIGLDWLYAPVMDGSTCWTQGRKPWIIDRAIRACERSGTAAIVTNSMIMTHWNNRVTAHHSGDTAYRFVAYQSCGIGFAARREGLATVWKHVAVELADVRSPVLRVIDWSDDWSSARLP